MVDGTHADRHVQPWHVNRFRMPLKFYRLAIERFASLSIWRGITSGGEILRRKHAGEFQRKRRKKVKVSDNKTSIICFIHLHERDFRNDVCSDEQLHCVYVLKVLTLNAEKIMTGGKIISLYGNGSFQSEMAKAFKKWSGKKFKRIRIGICFSKENRSALILH